MTEQTTIPVKRGTARLIRAYKQNREMTYDEYLRHLIEVGER